jgi:hypothetical protein
MDRSPDAVQKLFARAIERLRQDPDIQRLQPNEETPS